MHHKAYYPSALLQSVSLEPIKDNHRRSNTVHGSPTNCFSVRAAVITDPLTDCVLLHLEVASRVQGHEGYTAVPHAAQLTSPLQSW